jgi:type VI secretion system protein ImpH
MRERHLSDRSAAAGQTFFSLMRRVDATLRQLGRHRPDWLRIETRADMSFAGGEIAAVEVERDDDGAVASLGVMQRHFTLLAPYGPLPLHVTEHVLHERIFERNRAFERFLSLLAADLAWLHYRAWADMHPALGHERIRHPFAERLHALVDPLRPGAADGASSAVQVFRRNHPAVFIRRGRSLTGLQRLLTEHFGLPVQVKPWQGQWWSHKADTTPRTLGRWRMGRRAWEVQHLVALEVGPIDADQFHLWRRGSVVVDDLVRIVADYTEGRVGAAVHVWIRTHPDMAARLGRHRLGTDFWTHPDHRHRRVTVFDARTTSQ